MSSILLLINGWPGSGKYTIGRLVAERIGARLVPNHAINGAGFAVSELGAPAYRAIVRRVRSAVYRQIVDAPPQERFILTNVLLEDEADEALFKVIAALAERRACPFLTVTLSCALAENRERLDTEARAMRRSLTDRQVLQTLREEHALLSPRGVNHLDLDSSETTPAENAEAIVQATEVLIAQSARAHR